MDWYFPSWNGDVRIHGEDGRTILTIIEPTAHEQRVLEAFGRFAANEQWVEGPSLWTPGGDARQSVTLGAPLLHVGLTLTHYLKPGIATLTAVRLPSGRTEAMGTAEDDFLPWISGLLGADAPSDEPGLAEALSRGVAHQDVKRLMGELDEMAEERARRAAAEQREEEARRREEARLAAEARRQEEERIAKERQEAIDARLAEERRKEEARKEEARKAEEARRRAATVRRPTPCCPNSIVRDVEPAREVLLAFLDDEQREQYLAERRFISTGGLTGHRYLFAHRHSPTALQIGKCTYDLDEGVVMHFHDWTVPPEEELLAAMLILRHREPWLRNEATTFGTANRFRNPFGDGSDGVADSGATADFGAQLARALGLRLPVWDPLLQVGG